MVLCGGRAIFSSANRDDLRTEVMARHGTF
jgi:hypothetical protein